MTDLIKFLRTSTSSAYNKVAADRIEALERDYKEACNEAADCYTKQCVAEAKLTKAAERLKTMADYNKYVVAPFLAELEGKK